jgi:coenzyme F420 hydrogenase subunit beta
LAAYKYSRRYWCFSCGVCYNQCPLTTFSVGEAESKIFGRPREKGEELGVHRGYYVARSTKSDVLNVAQDGGVVTSILDYALKSGKVDCSVVSGTREDSPWKPWPMAVTTHDDLIKSAGSKYTPSPVLYGLTPAVDRYGKHKIAVVGTPCNIWGIRKMQIFHHRLFNSKLAEAIKFTIGIFCLEAYDYAKLFGYIQDQGIDPKIISRFEIREGRFLVNIGEKKVIDVPVKDLKALARECCHHCTDYAADLADISVGGVGCQHGSSIVILRSEEGEKLFEEAVKEGFLESKKVSESDTVVTENLKLARFKRKKAIVPHIP